MYNMYHMYKEASICLTFLLVLAKPESGDVDWISQPGGHLDERFPSFDTEHPPRLGLGQ